MDPEEARARIDAILSALGCDPEPGDEPEEEGMWSHLVRGAEWESWRRQGTNSQRTFYAGVWRVPGSQETKYHIRAEGDEFGDSIRIFGNMED